MGTFTQHQQHFCLPTSLLAAHAYPRASCPPPGLPPPPLPQRLC